MKGLLLFIGSLLTGGGPYYTINKLLNFEKILKSKSLVIY